MPASSDGNLEILKALFMAQGEIGAITTDAVNEACDSRYARLPKVIAAVEPALRKYQVMANGRVEQPDDKSLKVTIRFTHLPSGEWYEESLTMELTSTSPMEIASVSTYARRYILLISLNLPTPDDDVQSASDLASSAADGPTRTLNQSIERQQQIRKGPQESGTESPDARVRLMYEVGERAMALLGEQRATDVLFRAAKVRERRLVPRDMITTVTEAFHAAIRMHQMRHPEPAKA